MRTSPLPPAALLLIAPGCPHCPAVLDALGRLVKDGAIGRLEVVNIAVHPEAAAEVGTRSVPWIRIGPFELEGLHPPGELRAWAERAAIGNGWGDYYGGLLERHRIDRVVGLLREHPMTLHELTGRLASLETPLVIRIGIGAVIEELAGSEILDHALPELIAQLDSEQPQVRADACHYLGIAGRPGGLAAVRRMLDDPSPEVQEIAAESLALLDTQTR